MSVSERKLLVVIFVLFMIGCTPSGDLTQFQSEPESSSAQSQSANDVYPQVTQSQRFSVEKRGKLTIHFTVDQVTQIRSIFGSKDPLEIVLISPKGKRFSASSVKGSGTAMYYEVYQKDFQSQPYSYLYTVRNPDAGEWRAEVKHTNSGEINFINEALSHILLQVYALENRYEPGELATIVARLKNIDSQEYHQGVEIRGEARYADGNIGVLLFYDDGTHGDSVAGDGQWTAQIQTPDEPTIVGVKVYAKKDLIHREADSIVSVGI